MRKNIVFGRGSIPADILFVGEGPGGAEDMLGEPFVGPSGRLLKQAMELAVRFAGLEKAPSHFITNVIGCRATDAEGDNRAPTQEEAWACWPRLNRTFNDVHPRRVVLLGKEAARNCKKAWPDARILPHPAFLLRLGGTENPAFVAFARDLSALFLELVPIHSTT